MHEEKFAIVLSLLALGTAGCGSDSTPGQGITPPPPDSGATDTGGSNPDDVAPDSNPDDTPPGDTRPCEGSTLTNGEFKLTHNGVEYGYLVHLPPSYDGTKRTPLLLNWHAVRSTAFEEQIYTGTNAVADEQGFIVVYPNSPDKSWNAGTCCTPPDAGMPDRDDVGFARDLVAEISKAACIDSKRVYATGMSNGGFMSHRLACEAADLFAAVVPVAATMGVANCQPARPIAIMHHHGTADTDVGYEDPKFSAEGVGIVEMMSRWAARDGCTKGPDVTFQKEDVTCQTWSQCSGGVLVTLCTAEGAAHCWPGADFCPLNHPFTTNISASRDGWAFMKRFVLP